MKKIILDEDLIYDLYVNQFLTCREIALILGVSYYPVTNFIKKIKFKECLTSDWKNKKNIIRKEKSKDTCLLKYGVEHYQQTDEHKEKSKITCMEKYGTSHHSKTEEYKEKVKKTSLERYGVEYYNNRPLALETTLSRYGVNHFSKTDEFIEKCKITSLEKYGVEHYAQSIDAQTELKNKCLLKYGVEHYAQSHHFNNIHYGHDETLLKIINENDGVKFREYIESLGFDNRRDITDYLKISPNTVNVLFRKFGMKGEYSKWLYSPVSSGHNEVTEFIQSIYAGYILDNDRKVLIGKELDIYIPEKNLAIEYNGIYWHSECSGEKDKKYHLNKTELCESQGIQLLHIYDSEWDEPIKQEIWKSIIRNKLGLITEKIAARKCAIKEITPTESREFLDINHLSGFVGAAKHLGMFYETELVSVMSYGKSRFKKNEVEIIRFASKINCVIIGALGKFMKLLPDDVITYADRRFSSPLSCGYNQFFSNMEITAPNWWGFKYNEELKHRMAYQKHKLQSMFDYDESISAFDNMINNGYDRIWDCGNMKFSGKKL